MTFVIIEPPTSSAMQSIGDDEVHLTTRHVRGCKMIVLRFGRSAVKRLGLQPETTYSAMWGEGSDLGKLRLTRTESGSKGWVLKQPKRGRYPQFTLSRLPTQYGGREYKGVKVHAEFIQGGVKNSAYVQILLPRDFYTEEGDQ